MEPTALLSLFLPLFVSMDPLGALPAFIQMTGQLPAGRRKQLINRSILTAGAVGLLFLFVGPSILSALGLTSGDFQIAGGLLVLVIALRDVVWDQKILMVKVSKGEGIVPIGIPLLVGPAVLATLVLLQSRFSSLEITGSFSVNLFLSWIVFHQASKLIALMGVTGTRVISKLAALFFSAYGVMMIRAGLMSLMN